MDKKEYIERGALISILDAKPLFLCVARMVSKLPAADVVEVVHGEWKLGKSGCMYFCGKCNYAAHPREVDEWGFCPQCGARMDGERKEQA